MPGCKCSTLTYCHWWSSLDILHCAVVWSKKVTLTHWWVNGEHCLVGTHSSIHHSLGLLVGSIGSYQYPISPPGDSSSRSTSGGAGKGVCWAIEGETSHIRWTCMIIWVKDRNTTNWRMWVMLDWWQIIASKVQTKYFNPLSYWWLWTSHFPTWLWVECACKHWPLHSEEHVRLCAHRFKGTYQWWIHHDTNSTFSITTHRSAT